VEPLDDETEPVARAVLGADFELDPFYDWAEADDVLRGLVALVAGLRPAVAPDPYEALVSAITAQQVSLFAAFAIRNRMVERFGLRGVHAYAFPTRERMSRASEDELTKLGFSRRKAEYVLGVARTDVDFQALRNLSDNEVKATLTAIRGLGDWTADWFLARHLARPRAARARGRSRPGKGGLGLLLGGPQVFDRRGARGRRPVRAVPEPDRPLPPGRLPDVSAGMKVRDAGSSDRERLRGLYTDFVSEIPAPPGVPVDIEHELRELDDSLGNQNV